MNSHFHIPGFPAHCAHHTCSPSDKAVPFSLINPFKSITRRAGRYTLQTRDLRRAVAPPTSRRPGLCVAVVAGHASAEPHLSLGSHSVLNGVGIINHCHLHMGTAKPPEIERERERGPPPPVRSSLHITHPRGWPGNVPEGLPPRWAQ